MRSRRRNSQSAAIYAYVATLIALVAAILIFNQIRSDSAVGDHPTTISDVSSTPVQSSPQSASSAGPNRWLIIGIVVTLVALVAAVLAIGMAHLAFRWRKSVQGEQTALLPNKAIDLVDGLKSATVEQTQVINRFAELVSDNIREVRESSGRAEKGREDVLQALALFQESLTSRDAEIARLRKGGDATVFRRFLGRFIRVVKSIEEDIEDTENAGDNASVLKDIRALLEDALEDCGVDVFYPDLGQPYAKAYGVAENPRKVLTGSEEKHLHIESVVQPGYALVTSEGQDLLKEAVVTVYEYQAEGQ